MDCKRTCQLHNQTCPPKVPSCSEVPELLQALGPSSLAAGQQAISSQTKGACTMAAWVLRRQVHAGVVVLVYSFFGYHNINLTEAFLEILFEARVFKENPRLLAMLAI